MTGATSIEPVPQPECTSCHGIHEPTTVKEAVQRLRTGLADLATGKTAIIIPADVRVLLTALERHHSPVVEP